MKLFVFTLTIIFTSFKISLNQINPTGTYILKGMLKKNIIVGQNGEIRAKLLAENKLAISFYLNNGSPNFESASFSDTFFYFDNRINYHSLKDTDCTITFVFNATYVETYFIHSTPECSCGFYKGVIIPAVFEKSSSDIPVIKNISRN